MAAKNGGSHAKKGGMGGAAIGVGLAAAAIAGAYYLYGSKEGAKRRAQVKGWTLRAKGEVLDKLEALKDVNEEAYNKIVDAVADKYKKVKNVDVAELAILTQDLKRHWSSIKRQLNTAPKKPARKGASPKKASPKKGGDSK